MSSKPFHRGPARTYIIAEAGVNHNGDPAMAAQLVNAAAMAGADAVKFQTFCADKLVSATAETAAYQQDNTGERSQREMLKKLELSLAAHAALAAQCEDLGIEFLSTPFDEASADGLLRLGMKRIKVPSGELTNLPFLGHLARAGRPMIISTGMAELGEVREAVVEVMNIWARHHPALRVENDLTLLHCTSNYPAAAGTVNLRAIATLAQEFGVPAGYSDHTEGTIASLGAVALGATVIEKHFTLSRTLPGPDHKASLEPGDFARMVSEIRRLESMFGDGVKAPVAEELPVRDLVRRSVVARRRIAAGAAVVADDLQLLRPGTGIPPKHLAALIGRRARQEISAGEMVRWEQFAE